MLYNDLNLNTLTQGGRMDFTKMDAEDFADHLANVTQPDAAGWWRASCPGPKHEHGNVTKPALTFRDGDDGKLGPVKCHVGCTRSQIFTAIESSSKEGNVKEKTVKAATKPLGPIVREYIYKDKAGKPVFRRTRHDPKEFRPWRLTASGEWAMGLAGATMPVYRLDQLQGKGNVLVVEGEKDADRGNALGIPTTTTGGTGSWQ